MRGFLNFQAKNATIVRGAPLRTTSQIRRASSKSPFELKPKYAEFKKVQASRPAFDHSLPITYTKTPDPEWKYGKGSQDTESKDKGHIEIDPYEKDRPMIANYRLLVSGVPRPISFVSTVSKDGQRNLAPFSYFQVVDHDPPIFVIGFSGRANRPKDTHRNLMETGECVINVVSDHMIESVNATSLDIAHGCSEWGLSGFHPAPSATVKAERVREAVFSIEGKLLDMKLLDYHGDGETGKPSGSLAIIQATRFWVREDAINETQDEIDLSVMRPLVQLGGIQYGRVRETFELPRPSLSTELADETAGLAKFLEDEK
jgi:flavin reductase (DIM6/NTAB) family NADH-FMN oxidoreductase RutF